MLRSVKGKGAALDTPLPKHRAKPKASPKAKAGNGKSDDAEKAKPSLKRGPSKAAAKKGGKKS